MLKNVGKADRYIRILLGLAIIIAGIVSQSWWGIIGIVLLLTAGLSFCPLYAILGLTTRKTSKS